MYVGVVSPPGSQTTPLQASGPHLTPSPAPPSLTARGVGSQRRGRLQLCSAECWIRLDAWTLKLLLRSVFTVLIDLFRNLVLLYFFNVFSMSSHGCVGARVVPRSVCRVQIFLTYIFDNCYSFFLTSIVFYFSVLTIVLFSIALTHGHLGHVYVALGACASAACLYLLCQLRSFSVLASCVGICFGVLCTASACL